MARVNELKEMAFKVGLYNVSKLDDFDFDIKDNKDYLMHILKFEYVSRKRNALQTRRKKSKLPVVDMKKQYTGIEEWNMKGLLKLDWLEKCNNLVFYGKCGTGKTQAAVMIADKALDKGYRVYYIKIDELMNVLKTKDVVPKSKKTYEYLKQCDLIIIDDVMYIPLTEEELLILYKVAMFLGESRSLIFVTNRRLGDWKDAYKEVYTIETLVDRLLTYSRIVMFK